MLNIIQIYFLETTINHELVRLLIENIQILFNELTDETNFLYNETKEINFLNEFHKHLQYILFIPTPISFLKPILPRLNRFPSIIHGFLQAKFLCQLYNFALKPMSTNLEIIHCPIDQLDDDLPNSLDAFEILLILSFRATYDQLNLST